MSNTLCILSASHVSIISFFIFSVHLRFFSFNIGLNSYTSCSNKRVKLILLYCNVILDKLNRAISKNSLIKSSNRSALFNVIPRYFFLSSGDICSSSYNKFKYPITDARGVFKSWARYIIKSFLFCSVNCMFIFCFSMTCLIVFIFFSITNSSGDKEISSTFSFTNKSILLLISIK